ncbi:MAG: hypothetical protein U1E78_12485 [Gammaproteobacteria bacterium]
MTAIQAHLTFQYNVDETEKYLASFGNDSIKRNAAINNTYLKLYKEDPTFIWLAAAVLGSRRFNSEVQPSYLVNSIC